MRYDILWMPMDAYGYSWCHFTFGGQDPVWKHVNLQSTELFDTFHLASWPVPQTISTWSGRKQKVRSAKHLLDLPMHKPGCLPLGKKRHEIWRHTVQCEATSGKMWTRNFVLLKSRPFSCMSALCKSCSSMQNSITAIDQGPRRAKHLLVGPCLELESIRPMPQSPIITAIHWQLKHELNAGFMSNWFKLYP